MAITSGFFNSVDGDRTYNADDMSNYFEGLISSGVIANPNTSLQVTADGTGMTAIVAVGRGFINNRWIKNDAAYSVVLTAANALLNRIDAIVMRYRVSNREITIEVKTGTAAATPIVPTMTRNPETIEYCLATIYVNAGVTAISSTDITDTRGDSDVCGWVTNLVTPAQTAVQIRSYTSTYTTTEQTSTIPIGVDEYDANDALILTLGGIVQTEGVTYTISGTNIVFAAPVAANRTYYIIVLKAVAST